MELGNVLSIEQYVTKHGLDDDDAKRVRRYCRKHEHDDAHVTKFGGKRGVWVIDGDYTIPLPDVGTRGFVSKRTDGRRRYIAYFTDDERDEHAKRAGADSVIDTRERAKMRRAAKRTAKPANTKTGKR